MCSGLHLRLGRASLVVSVHVPAAACKLPAHGRPAFPQMMSTWLAKHELGRRAMSDLARNARQLAAWHRHTQQHGERGAGAQAADACAQAACFNLVE